MATFAAKLIFYFAIFMVFSVRVQVTGSRANNRVKNAIVSSYLMKLYNIWTNQSNQTAKIPGYNATAVRAMYFTSIQKMSKNLMKLIMDTHGGKKNISVKRDELHLYIIKPSTTSHAQTFTIQIKDSQANTTVMASQTIKLQTTAWYTIPMNGKIQNWFNRAQPKTSLDVEFKFRNAIANQVYPSIGTSLLEQPYLIVYMDD